MIGRSAGRGSRRGRLVGGPEGAVELVPLLDRHQEPHVPAAWGPGAAATPPCSPARRSIVSVACLQHRRKTRRLLLPPPHRARLFKSPAQAEPLQRLLAVQLLLEPADGFLHRFTFSQLHFSHNPDSTCSPSQPRPGTPTYRCCLAPSLGSNRCVLGERSAPGVFATVSENPHPKIRTVMKALILSNDAPE